jgi:hypothetical protein
MAAPKAARRLANQVAQKSSTQAGTVSSQKTGCRFADPDSQFGTGYHSAGFSFSRWRQEEAQLRIVRH